MAETEGSEELQEYLIIKPSPYTYTQTVERAHSTLDKSGFTLLTTVSYNQADAGYPLTTLILNSPELEKPLIQENPLTAHLIPFKVIIWQESQGRVLISYLAAEYIDEIDLSDKETLLQTITRALEQYTDDIIATPQNRLPELI